MDTTLLKTWARFAGIASLSLSMGCSLVIDTDECITSADCEFGDGAQMECVASECVPTAQRRQELVPANIGVDTSLSIERSWRIEGLVVIEANATLTIEPRVQIELQPGALLVVERGARLQLLEARPELESYVIDENASEMP